MKPKALAVVQSTSPMVAPLSYWCVQNTLQYAGFETLPYHTYVPSFGEWGFFVFAQQLPPDLSIKDEVKGLRYFNATEFASMTHFSNDMRKNLGQVQRLDNQVLVYYFEKEWGEY